MDCNNIYKFYDNHVKYLKQYKNKINYIEIDLETPKSYCNNDNEIIIINEDINNIEDLINISKKYTDNQKYNVNIPALTKIIEPLTKLNNLVGLTDIKIQVFEQVLYLIQNTDDHGMLHTVIRGPPGTGKTEFSKILGEIYKKLGILSKGEFISVKKSDLIGNHLGETSIKTQTVLNKCKGSVMFIDEAYSIGSIDNKDIYSKECIDTITSFLTEEKDDFILILAGYKNDLKKYIFNNNEGLDRRFNWIYDLSNYSYKDLKNIFIKIVDKNNWKININNDKLEHFFNTNMKYFNNYGGDMDTLFYKCKILSTSSKIKDFTNSKVININDLNKSLLYFKDKINKKNNLMTMMYS